MCTSKWIEFLLYVLLSIGLLCFGGTLIIVGLNVTSILLGFTLTVGGLGIVAMGITVAFKIEDPVSTV